MKDDNIISDTTKMVPACRGSCHKVPFHQVVLQYPNGDMKIVQTKYGDKVVQTVATIKFYTIGNGTQDYPGCKFMGFDPWGNIKMVDTRAKALGQVKRYMNTDDWRGQVLDVLITNYTDDLVYPDNASAQFAGKSSPHAGKWFARVMYN
tara:strand:+ start:447 stop:893 length:447 start_codon:yes stop_codon:yes gene_type:complete